MNFAIKKEALIVIIGVFFLFAIPNVNAQCPYCGNGICAVDEFCYTCPQDCPPPPNYGQACGCGGTIDCSGNCAYGWKTKTPGPANSRMAYGVINNKLYAAQGSQFGTGGGFYDPATDSLASIASAPAAYGFPASAVANQRLYSFGTATYEYNPSTNSWATRTSPPIELGWRQAATVGNSIYLVGGMTFYRYDVLSDSWTSLPAPPRIHFEWPAVAEVNGIIYAIGGSNPYTNAVDAYNPSTNSWSQRANIPAPLGYKGYASAVGYNGRVYVFGGGHWDSSTAETWEYDPSTNTWTRLLDMPTKRNVPAAGFINNKAYVYGGEYPGAVLGAIHEGTSPPPPNYGQSCNCGACGCGGTIQCDGSCSGPTPSCYTDIGLRVYDGTAIRSIAAEPQGTLTSPLRISKNGITYGIVLVDPSDPSATKIKIQTASGTKALRKLD